MIVTTYTCDNCGHAQTTDDQMWQVGIAIEHSHNYGYSYASWTNRAFQHQQLWCRKCVDKTGLLTPALKSAEIVAAPTPTFEDMLRAIIREEISQEKS
jgi:hypothetical protein